MTTAKTTQKPVAPKVHLLNPAEMDVLAERLPLIKAWVADVEAHLVHLLEQGEVLQHARLVPKDAIRTWVSEEDFCAVLEGLGYDLDRYKPRALLSPAKLEKEFGKKAMGPLVAEHTQRISSGLKLVLGNP